MPKPSSKKNILPFKSFRRSYKGEYEDDFEAPGLFAHALKTFGFIFKNSLYLEIQSEIISELLNILKD